MRPGYPSSACRLAPWIFPPVALLGVSLLYPLIRLIVTGLSDPGDSLLVDPFFWRTLWFTIAQALASTFLSFVIGTSAAFLWAESDLPGKEWLWRLSMVCFSLPSILVVLGILGFWGSSGWMNEFLRGIGMPGLSPIFGWTGILTAHAFLNFPLFLKYIGTALVDIDRTEERVALSLGATRLRVLGAVTWRKIAPAARSALALCFLYCASSFLIVLMLGGGPRYSTLEVRIYQAVKVEFDLALAVKLALVQLSLSGVIYWLVLRVPPAIPERPRAAPEIPLFYPRSRRWRFAAYVGFWLVFVGLVGGPLASVIAGGLSGLRALELTEITRPLFGSLGLAGVVALISSGMALSLAYAERHATRSWISGAIQALASFPVAVSTVLLALALRNSYPLLLENMRGSWMMIAIVQSVAALPLAFRAVHDGFLRIPTRLYDAARGLGAGRWRVWWDIELPLLRPVLGLGALLAAAVSLGEVSSPLLFMAEGITTLPLEVYRSLGAYRFAAAYAQGVCLFVVMAAVYGLMSRRER